MKPLIVLSALLSAYCFLSVLIEQREIAGLEKRLTMVEYLNQIVDDHARLIQELSDSSIDATAKAQGATIRPPVVSGCSAMMGKSTSTQGFFTAGVTGECRATLSFPVAAPNGYACVAESTSGGKFYGYGNDGDLSPHPGSCAIVIQTVDGDRVKFEAHAY